MPVDDVIVLALEAGWLQHPEQFVSELRRRMDMAPHATEIRLRLKYKDPKPILTSGPRDGMKHSH